MSPDPAAGKPPADAPQIYIVKNTEQKDKVRYLICRVVGEVEKPDELFDGKPLERFFKERFEKAVALPKVSFWSSGPTPDK